MTGTGGSLGLYQPGNSLLHKTPAGWKLLFLAVAVIGVALLDSPWQIGIAAVAVTGFYALARIPPRMAMANLWPLRYMIVIVAVLQVILAGWQRAVMVCGALVVSIALAALVTLTTKVSAILDSCTRVLRPLRRVGVDPDRVGLVLALTIRCIPLLVDIIGQVSQARKARGLDFSATALAAPVVVRALRAADAIGDALIARGVDD